MDNATWREALQKYKPYFDRWLEQEGYVLGELDLQEFWQLFKHWFYNIRPNKH